ncbi:hypothetical protein HK099_002609, partial [Clydaea vesicula]
KDLEDENREILSKFNRVKDLEVENRDLLRKLNRAQDFKEENKNLLLKLDRAQEFEVENRELLRKLNRVQDLEEENRILLLKLNRTQAIEVENKELLIKLNRVQDLEEENRILLLKLNRTQKLENENGILLLRIKEFEEDSMDDLNHAAEMKESKKRVITKENEEFSNITLVNDSSPFQSNDDLSSLSDLSEPNTIDIEENFISDPAPNSTSCEEMSYGIENKETFISLKDNLIEYYVQAVIQQFPQYFQELKTNQSYYLDNQIKLKYFISKLTSIWSTTNLTSLIKSLYFLKKILLTKKHFLCTLETVDDVFLTVLILFMMAQKSLNDDIFDISNFCDFASHFFVISLTDFKKKEWEFLQLLNFEIEILDNWEKFCGGLEVEIGFYFKKFSFNEPIFNFNSKPLTKEIFL